MTFKSVLSPDGNTRVQYKELPTCCLPWPVTMVSQYCTGYNNNRTQCTCKTGPNDIYHHLGPKCFLYIFHSSFFGLTNDLIWFLGSDCAKATPSMAPPPLPQASAHRMDNNWDGNQGEWEMMKGMNSTPTTAMSNCSLGQMESNRDGKRAETWYTRTTATTTTMDDNNDNSR